MTSASDPEQIRREIERTQANLSQDVDALTEKVTPGKIVERRLDRARSSANRLKDKVMGSNPLSSSSGHVTTGTYGGGYDRDYGDTGPGLRDRASDVAGQVSGTASDAASRVQGAASSAASSVQDAAYTAADRIQGAPQAVRRQTQGNPLAAGVVAFGLGWLVSSLLPASRREQELAAQAKDAAQENLQPIAQQVATEVKENLQPVAQQAVESVKSTAQDAGQTVAEEGRSAAQDVQGRAQDAAGNVRGSATSS